MTALENAIKRFKAPKYHLIRLPRGTPESERTVREKVTAMASRNHWDLHPTFGDDVCNFNLFISPPVRHHIFFIKGQLPKSQCVGGGGLSSPRTRGG